MYESVCSSMLVMYSVHVSSTSMCGSVDGCESGRVLNDGEVWLAVREFFVCHGEM